jgi:hypothetical protein
MHFPPISCRFIPPWSKYSPQHPVLKHPQSILNLNIFVFTVYATIFLLTLHVSTLMGHHQVLSVTYATG